MTKTETSLARIFAICDQVAESGEHVRTEEEAKAAAESFLGLLPVVTKYPCGPPVEPLTVHPEFLNDKAHGAAGGGNQPQTH